MRITDIAERSAAYGIPGFSVDGMDVIAVRRSAVEAVNRARRGEGPTLLEYKTYRYAGHSRGDPGRYRLKEEIEHWRKNDPIPRFRALLLRDHGLEEEQLQQIERDCQSEVEDSVAFARSSPDPSPEACFERVYSETEARL